MTVRFTERADKDYSVLDPVVRKAFAKQLGFLLNNLAHPSLHAKKYNEAKDIWQARVNRNWRFYFVIQETNT
jgi:mRNA interferase RelE/StbE